jgi:hypothetical protein
VRRHAKASSAGSLSRPRRLGSVRRAFATHGVSFGAEGNSAYSGRGFVGVLALALLFAFAAAPASAHVTRLPIASFGVKGTCEKATGTGTLTSGSPTITALVTSCGAFEVGQTITGAGIPSGATIAAIVPANNELTLSVNAIASGPTVALKVAAPFLENNDLAFNQATRKLYVLDKNSAVQGIFGFDASTPGAYTLLEPPAFPKPLHVELPGASNGLAVDNTAFGSAGRLYYASASASAKTAKIFSFDSSGTELAAPAFPGFPIAPIPLHTLCGVSVDPATSNFAVGNNRLGNEEILRFTSSGSVLPVISAAGQGRVCKVAFDTNGDLYATVSALKTPTANAGSGIGVWKYTAAGTGTLTTGSTTVSSLTTTFGQFEVGQPISGTINPGATLGIPAGATITAVIPGENKLILSAAATASGSTAPLTTATRIENDTSPAPAPTAIALDTTTRHLFVAHSSNIVEYDSSGNKLAEFGKNTFSDGVSGASFGGVAVDQGTTPAETRIYASDVGNKKVDVFGPVVTMPDPETKSATETRHTSALLNGTVNPSGESLEECFFEWGKTTAYGEPVVPCEEPAAAVIGSGSDPVAVHANLTGLLPGTTYHFRLAATNASGKSSGSDQSLLTSPIGFVEVFTESANPVTGTKATLNGKVNDGETALTDCHFEWGAAAPAYGKTALCEYEYEPGKKTTDVSKFPADLNDHPVTANLTGLVPNGSTYHFRLVAANASGSSPGSDFKFTTPNTVVTGSASSIAGTTATLNGTVNPDNAHLTDCHFEYVTEVAFQETGFSKLGSGGSASCAPGFASIPNDSSAHSVSAALSGLATGTAYRFRLVAAYEEGIGTISGAAEALPTKGPEVTHVAVTAISDTSARFVAKINPRGNETAYQFKWGLTDFYGNAIPAVPASVGNGTVAVVVNQPLSGLSPSTTYHFELTVANEGGSSNGGDLTFTTHASLPEPNPCPNAKIRTQQDTTARLPECRAYEMVTPPLKANRTTGAPNGQPHLDGNPGLASIDGNELLWFTSIFPLSGESAFAFEGEIAKMHRTPSGWATQSQITQKPLPGGEVGAKTAIPFASSADFAAQSWKSGLPLLENASSTADPFYTRRDGAGVNGFLGWLDNVDGETSAYGLPSPKALQSDNALFNDDGSAMVRWGRYRGLSHGVGVEHPSAAEDPSVNLLPGIDGGQAIYRQGDPPDGPRELVNGCTGTAAGGDATQIPTRIGSGTSTDTLGGENCQTDTGVLATGAGTRTDSSATLTGVSTASGAFSVGQIVSGAGIPRGTVITGIGAGTLTLSSDACGEAAGKASHSNSSPLLTEVTPTCGGDFSVGQTITGDGIPAGTTIIAVGNDTITISQNPTDNPTGPQPFSIPGAGTYVTNDLSSRARSIVSTAGAIVGGDIVTTAMSNDGRHVFFEAPDPAAGPSICSTATGPATSCPPQLYVRQYDSGGTNPAVRWISRSRSTLDLANLVATGAHSYGGSMIGGQQVGLMGSGATFEGASRDGLIVYFRTNAPLTPDDPNATGSAPVTTGAASGNSWDLYQYKLPAGGDPGDGSLTRISGGPTVGADPDIRSGSGAARYISDDGKRVYFVTTAPIAGADSTPPQGGVTTPGGAVGNSSTGNLYLFDETQTGPERYKFIARISSTCAMSNAKGPGADFASSGSGEARQIIANPGNSCVHGTPNGDAVTFETVDQLTADDTDGSSDIYIYDARTDKLSRVSAPPSGTSSYTCPATFGGSCNADFGFRPFPSNDYETMFGWGGARHYNIAEGTEGNVSVFFETRLSLLEEDTNGSYWDTYQWREGKLSLVSPGDSNNDAYFSGASTDGHDVFFNTSQRIDPRELDNFDYDIYDARVEGGFEYTPKETPCDVLALKCEEVAGEPPPAVTSASRGVGPGNPKERARGPKCATGKLRKHGRCVNRHKRKRPRQHKRATGANHGRSK